MKRLRYCYIFLTEEVRILNVLMGVFFIAILNKLITNHWAFSPANFYLTVLVVINLIAGNIINNYFDFHIDISNMKKRVLSNRQRLILYVLLILCQLVIFFLHSNQLSSFQILIISLATVLLLLYSPFLKKVYLGNFIVAFLFVLLMLLFYEKDFYENNRTLTYFIAFFSFFLTIEREFVKDIIDLKGDRLYGKKTLPMIISPKLIKVVYLIFSVMLIAILLFFLYQFDINSMTIFYTIVFIPIYLIKTIIFYKNYSKILISQLLKFLMFLGILSIFLY